MIHVIYIIQEFIFFESNYIVSSEKLYVSCEQLMIGSVILARKVLDSGFFYQDKSDKYKNYLLGIWRGGTYPGIFCHEFFKYKGLTILHFPIKTEFYTGTDQVKKKVSVWGIDDIIEVINAEDKLLIIDDVWDRGWSLHTVLHEIRKRARKNAPEMKTAVVFYKPEKNETELEPNFYVAKTNRWIIFPHELEDLTQKEIETFKHPVFEKMLFEENTKSFEEFFVKSMQ